MSDRRNEATYRAITGGRSPHTERQGDWRIGLRLVVDIAGGNVSAAARALDVPRRTMRRWLAGEGAPRGERRAQVAALARQYVRRAERRNRLSAGRERRLRAARTVTIAWKYRYDVNTDPNARERRTVFDIGGTGSTGLAGDTMAALVDAYLAGAEGRDGEPGADTGGLFSRIADRMGDEWYRDHMTSTHPDDGVDINEVRFGR